MKALIFFGLLLVSLNLVSATQIFEGYGIDWNFQRYNDPLEEVYTYGEEINNSVLELTIVDHINSTTKNGYKWKMAFCNYSEGDLYIQYEDNQGGFEYATWIKSNYGKLINYGMDSSWCNDTNGFGYVLFSSGSKNQLPAKIRLLVKDFENFTTHAGTGSAKLVGLSTVAGALGTGKNICRTSDGKLHVAYENANGHLSYANASYYGDDWINEEIDGTGVVQHPTIVCDQNDTIQIFYINGNNLVTINKTKDGSWPSNNWTIATGASERYEKPHCIVENPSTNQIGCVYSVINTLMTTFDTLDYDNSSSWGSSIELPAQSSVDDGKYGYIGADNESNVYIIMLGTVQDDIDITSSINNFVRREPIATALGNVNANVQGGKGGFYIAEDGTMITAQPMGADLNICIGNTTTWDSTSDWYCNEISPLETRATDVILNDKGYAYIYHASNNAPNSSTLLRANTTNIYGDWENRTEISNAGNVNPSILGSLYPAWNRPNNTANIIFSNWTGTYYLNESIDGSDEFVCQYLGRGNWVVQLINNCSISNTQDVSSNEFILEGSVGSFTIESTGYVLFDQMTWPPSTPSWYFLLEDSGKMDWIL